jgi:hypothetical protein
MATTLDEALDIVHRAGPDLVNGNSNHAPMVAEALCTLGRAESVSVWLEEYKNRFQDRPLSRTPISPGVGRRPSAIEVGVKRYNGSTNWPRGWATGRPAFRCCPAAHRVITVRTRPGGDPGDSTNLPTLLLTAVD